MKNIAMKNNPFKFGPVVDGEFFTNRVKEQSEILALLNSENHLLLSSPRRYGKTSLVLYTIKQTDRPWIYIDLQLITSVADLASQILRRAYQRFPMEKIKSIIKGFRILPNISVNPLTNEFDIQFGIDVSQDVILEDVTSLLEKLGKSNKLIVIFDEFQEIERFGKNIDRQLRSLFQHLKNINFIFMGSQESLIRHLFLNSKAPFYHFCHVISLKKLPTDELIDFIAAGISQAKDARNLAEQIVNFTDAHPFYSQQLAYSVWNLLPSKDEKSLLPLAINEIVSQHDNDYERLWVMLNTTDHKLLIGLAVSKLKPLSEEFIRMFAAGATSTVYSALKRLAAAGYVYNDNGYQIEDPFFKYWIVQRRSRFS